MQEVKSVREADVRGKRVLVRADFDVPLQNGKVADDTRLQALVPTLRLLQEKGATQIILIAHLGRPGGVMVPTLSLAPVGARLQELIALPNMVVRENLRFDPREEANDDSFAQELAKLGDVYINEAFADSHREHASIVGIPKYLPSYAGLRLEEEIEKLSHALEPPKGSVAVIGGSKFETKQPVLDKLLRLYVKIYVGGAIANDVLKARGLPVGESLISPIPVPESVAGSTQIIVATDATLLEGETKRIGFISDTRAHEKIVDVGPESVSAWSKEIATAPFVLWNGPLGMYEVGCIAGTESVAEAVTKASRAVLGGSDTIAAVKKFSFDPNKVFLSVGGGAMLDFLVDGTLPGIEALKRNLVG